MRNVVFSFVRIYDGSIVASVRIGKLVSEIIDAPLISDLEIKEYLDEPLDNLLIVNGAYAFCRCLSELGALIRRARRVVWLQNDYTIITPKAESNAESPFRKAFRERHAAGLSPVDYWTTVQKNISLTKFSSYVNWNCLTFDEGADEKTATGGDLFYYGSYRQFRQSEFDRYFTSSMVPVTISNPGLKGVNKFEQRYKSEQIVHMTKIEGSLTPELRRHGAGLYIEDKLSHSEFHSPANRFYEMLSAGLPMIFQPECGSMMRKAGYDPSLWLASSSLEVRRAFDRRVSIGREQRDAWLAKARAEREVLGDSVRDAMRRLG